MSPTPVNAIESKKHNRFDAIFGHRPLAVTDFSVRSNVVQKGRNPIADVVEAARVIVATKVGQPDTAVKNESASSSQFQRQTSASLFDRHCEQTE